MAQPATARLRQLAGEPIVLHSAALAGRMSQKCPPNGALNQFRSNRQGWSRPPTAQTASRRRCDSRMFRLPTVTAPDASLGVAVRTSTGTLTCADVEEKGSGAAFRAEELAGLTSLEQEDLKKCTVLLGKERLSPNQSLAIWDAAPELATISNCSQDVVRELAALATDERAFGSPRGWTSVQVGSVGCILAGLQSIADIPAEAFEGLTANIVECLPSETFQVRTPVAIE
ncbi:unnamed protein product [Nesidiocoris tenuis]|uniref:Uncharacterized protein n=1 Tax=Nesidiocoris tenuis TaxID=355587 RepID=A0A6H5G657_9HEMI|nr:unnamed protein product [Nesidiocoris tenuis]